MTKTKIAPEGVYLITDIVLTEETRRKLENPENKKRIQAFKKDMPKYTFYTKDIEGIVTSFVRYKLENNEDIKVVTHEVEQVHEDFINFVRSLPVETQQEKPKDGEFPMLIVGIPVIWI